MSGTDPSDRLTAAIVGVVVGDALGVPVEFTGREMRDRDPVTGMRGQGTWRQLPGTWSDDSSMTLVNADVLADRGWDVEGMMAGYGDWLDRSWWTARGSVFDVGNTTRQAIMYHRIHGDWRECGLDEESANGNGSLMRCMPISCWLFGRAAEEMVRLAGEASSLTHAHIRSRLCCGWHALWCDAMLGGADVRTAVLAAGARLRRHVPEPERGPLARLLDGSVLDLPREQVPSDGYVVSTLEAAAWCLSRHRSYRDAVLAAVNLGGDTDTTAAVVGGMAGLREGLSGIPQEWLGAIARRDDVLSLAARFSNACSVAWSGDPGSEAVRPIP
jgi:ADP-ribosylglycohydrolase